MLNTPTVPYYPVEFTVYPDGKHSQERVLQRTVTVTRNNTGLTPTSYNSSLYVSATAYYDTAVTNSSIIALSPQPSLVHVAKTPALLDNDNDNGNSTEKPKHRTPQLMARQLQYEPAASLPPLKLRNRQSLSKTAQRLSIGLSTYEKSINQASKTKSASITSSDNQSLTLLQRRRRNIRSNTMLSLNCSDIRTKSIESNDATLLGADLKKDTPQLVLSPSLTTARIAPLATQIKQILEAEEAYLKRLELVRDAYWKPLCLRYPMQGQWTTNSSNSSISSSKNNGIVCSVAWSSTSDEDSEYESINDDNNDDNDSRLDESIMKDDTASVSTMLSSSTSTIATDDSMSLSIEDGITNDLNTFTDIQIDDILPATITDSSIKSKDTTTMPFQKVHGIKPRTSSLANSVVPSRRSSMALVNNGADSNKGSNTDNDSASAKKSARRESVWMRLTRIPTWTRRDSEVLPPPPPSSSTSSSSSLLPNTKESVEPSVSMTSSNSTTILLSALSTVLSSRNRTRSIISNGSSIMSTFSSVRSSSSSASSVCSSRAPSIASIPLLPSTIGKHHRAARAPVRLCDAIRPYTSIAELLDSLFAQLNMFIDLQTKLVCALRELDPNTATHQQVARAFLDLSKAFEVYADYADGHATALAAFENLRLTNPRFRRHLRHLQPSLLNDGYDVDTSSSSSSSIDLQELQTDTISSSDPARTEKNPMELTSLLSLPLKRIWHYVSLFETLKRHAIQAVPLGDRQPTLGAIQEFMDTLDSLDLRMNTNKRQIERVCQIAQLQRKIRHLPSLLLTHRQFILHEGMISWSNGEMKKPTHHSQRKEESRNSGSANSQETTPAYCWLLRDRILLGHQRASGAYTHKMTIRLSECTVYAPPVDMGRRNSSSSDRSSSSSSNSNSSSNSDMNTGRSLYIATADTHIRLHFDERRAFERWCGQIRLALTTLPRDSNKPTESGRIINANTAERWNPAHAGCYVHVDVFPFL